MRKIFAILAVVVIAACGKIDDAVQTEKIVVKGYMSEQTRTEFGTPREDVIPYKWSAGDYMWLGDLKSSNTLTSQTSFAEFTFEGGVANVGGNTTKHLFYNMTGAKAAPNKAVVLAEQSADGNLGNDGDFGYATLSEWGTFSLDHKTSFIWFDTKTNDSNMPKLTSIKVETTVNIAGECVFEYANDKWADAVTNGSNTITLNFEGGYALKSSNSGIMAAMVCLPAAVSGKTLTITYTFEGGSTYTETKTPSRDFVAGKTSRIATTIAKDNLVAPAPEYELKVLTFEGDKWTNLIDCPQMSGDILYGSDGEFGWDDADNTGIYHYTFNQCTSQAGYAGGGHAISNYVAAGYANSDLIPHFYNYSGYDTYYGYEGWQFLQLMIPISAYSGNNFAVHYGYIDYSTSYNVCGILPSFVFEDGEGESESERERVERVIDHMYVTNTNYLLNQVVYGVSREDGEDEYGNGQFGGNYDGMSDDTYLKIVAYGYDANDEDPAETDTDFGDQYNNPADNPNITKAEFYLVKGTRVVEDWQKWDLSVLGPVVKVKFNFEYSEDMGGMFGFTVPAYFAYDNVAVRIEK